MVSDISTTIGNIRKGDCTIDIERAKKGLNFSLCFHSERDEHRFLYKWHQITSQVELKQKWIQFLFGKMNNRKHQQSSGSWFNWRANCADNKVKEDKELVASSHWPATSFDNAASEKSLKRQQLVQEESNLLVLFRLKSVV